MTLLVAAIESGQIWMVADTSITTSPATPHERLNRPKIYPVANCSLIGFAGDVDAASRILRMAATTAPGNETLDRLLLGHVEYQTAGVDFAYGFMDKCGPHLFKISAGVAQELRAMYIGEHSAFARFQQIRHDSTHDHPPDAIAMYLFGLDQQRSHTIPAGIMEATRTMYGLFATSIGRRIGGIAIPYLLSERGVQLCAYAFSATDPIVRDLRPGSIVAHGSAQGGGFSVSITELAEHDGVVVYWLQKLGGCVFVRRIDGYDTYEFYGDPESFKNAVRTELGREVDVWFDSRSQGAVESLRVMNDEAGRPRLEVATSGSSVSFAWIQSTEDSFRVSGALPIEGEVEMDNSRVAVGRVNLYAALSDDRATATINIVDGEQESAFSFGADELNRLIDVLANARMSMHEPVALDVVPGTRLRAVIDPAWRTRLFYHPSVKGVTLVLRHPGLGWLSFLLPPNEARALGEWLTNAASSATEGPPTS